MNTNLAENIIELFHVMPAATTNRFNEFWAIYPRKVAKLAAIKAWAKATKLASVEEILRGVEAYKRNKPAYADWAHPTTWLNAGRWMDEPDATQAVAQATPKLSEVCAYAKEKWGDDSRHSNWANSFYRFWADPKRNWRRQGKLVDWACELGKQVSIWRTTQ